ncbi:MAG: dTDP-glucose 4,6-dehydratase [Acidobacteria bacterium]|nr:MAG: dTDP-glucose 4,6-dehydratase [Acidobacteriota bacterium]
MRYLVTGGAGFIGSHFVHALLNTDPDAEIVNLDLLTYAGNPENIADLQNHPRHRFVKGDICDRPLVDQLMSQIDAVVHFAAESFVDRSIYNADSFIRTDIYGTFVLLETARKYSIKKFIHISTDEVYGSCERGSFREEDALMPTNPYAASKAGADRLAFSFYKTYDLPVIITRTCNNYGPNQYPEKLIPLFITNAIQDISLPVYGDGKQVRDWIYVQDHCSALIFLLKIGKPGEVYNISANQECANLAITEMILEKLKKPHSLIRYVTDRPGHDRRYSLDSSKLKNLGWKPEWNLKQGMESTIEWYVQHPEWWERIRDRQAEFREFYAKHYGTIGEGSWQTRPQ